LDEEVDVVEEPDFFTTSAITLDAVVELIDLLLHTVLAANKKKRLNKMN
jgi:hypothetical protein